MNDAPDSGPACRGPAADGLSRRDFMSLLGAGVLVAVIGSDADAQRRGESGDERRGPPARAPQTVAARLHLAADGTITVMSGKVECGQGVRAQLTQAAAEELGVPPSHVRVILGDTDLCPDDGGTYGSGSTPRTVPSVRRGAAAAREALIGLAAAKWGVSRDTLTAEDGTIRHADGRTIKYGELVGDAQTKAFAETAVTDAVQIRAVTEWRVMGRSLPRPNGRDIVTGAHRYPSGIDRPGMLFGVVLRPPAVGATLDAVDLSAATHVVTVRDGSFVGVAAASTALARQACGALTRTAKWSTSPQVGSADVFGHLRKTARDPAALDNPFAAEAKSAAHTLRREYSVAYVQHAPLEPRAAVAEWADGKLTVWTATQNPSGVRGELAWAFGLAAGSVRVIVPDFGGAFGGKHTGECAVECAKIAKAADKPVSLRWTREEEFQWASFRPAALVVADASLDAAGDITAWAFTNVNSGASGIRTPYRAAKRQERYVEAASPLRHGSYRGLAATANHFAREAFVDELAGLAGLDPLAFRLKHLAEPRLAAVLKAAADGFGWAERRNARVEPGVGYGLACGTEKGSFVAACVEVAVDPAAGNAVRVVRVRQAFECGKIINPDGLRAQVLGCVVQGLGPALWEAIAFDGGVVTNGRFDQYRVPRLSDVPPIDIDLLDRADLPSAGGSETPIVAIAPAIANALHHATGRRSYEMPLRVDAVPAAKA